MNAVLEAKKYEPKLPPAVAKLAAQADEAQKQFITPEPPPGDPPADPPVEPPVEPQNPPVEPPPPPPPADDEASFKHKYLTLQGRHNAEIGRMRGQLDAMNAQVANLNQLLATVKAPPPESTFQPTPSVVKSRITPEEVAEYGEEFIDFASRLAAQEASRVAAPLLRELDSLKQQVGGVGQTLHQSARDRLFQQLDEQIPKWRELNTTPEYLDWLALQDAYTGAIRQELLNDAFEQNDFPRVSAFFKGFLAELAATAPTPQDEPGSQGIKVPKIALNTIVAPGRAKSAAATPPGAPPEKPIITTSQISKFYTDKAAGKYNGPEGIARAKEFEDSIFLAQREGRIR